MRLWAEWPPAAGWRLMCCLLVWWVAGGRCARAAEARDAVSLTAFQAQVAQARQIVAGCEVNASACDASGLPEGQQHVTGGSSGGFPVSWGWLRGAVAGAKGAPVKERVASMRAAESHLTELAAEAGAARAVPESEFARARLAANAALARGEFQAAEGPSWIERRLAKVQDWLLQLFTGMDRLGRRAPWLAPLIEWGCFLLAAGGLLWFVRQSLARQALRIALGEGAALAPRGDRDSADWARLAEEHAAAQDWREAVHCLYWAAIALLESRRAWRGNPTRTPREYVRLLRPGSEGQRALRELTRSFERVWYGQHEADEAEYRRAMGSFQALQAAKAERAAPVEDAKTAALATAGGA